MYKINDIAISNKNFSDLNPVSCGNHSCEPSHNFGPHVREYYLLHYVVHGKGTFIKNNVYHHVEKNQIFIIEPHEVTTYTADSRDPWSYIWIGFTGTLGKAFSTLPPVITHKTNLFAEMLECESQQSCRQEFLASKLFSLYTQLFEDDNAPHDYAKQACDYINANYMNSLYITDISRLIGVERTYLSKLFKEKVGQSMQSYLIDVRLKHAASLLERGYNVSQAAAMCGYGDCFNFSKMFKKKYNMNPQAYKMTN